MSTRAGLIESRCTARETARIGKTKKIVSIQCADRWATEKNHRKKHGKRRVLCPILFSGSGRVYFWRSAIRVQQAKLSVFVSISLVRFKIPRASAASTFFYTTACRVRVAARDLLNVFTSDDTGNYDTSLYSNSCFPALHNYNSIIESKKRVYCYCDYNNNNSNTSRVHGSSSANHSKTIKSC